MFFIMFTVKADGPVKGILTYQHVLCVHASIAFCIAVSIY